MNSSTNGIRIAFIAEVLLNCYFSCDTINSAFTEGMELGVPAFNIPNGVSVRKRGDYLFIFNFTDCEKTLFPDREYIDVLTGEKTVNIKLGECGYAILK